MNKKAFLLLFLSLSAFGLTMSQTPVKKSLTHSDYDSWKELARPAVSANGQWVSFEINPQKGDGYLHLQNLQTGKHDSLSRGQEAVFSSTSYLMAFKIKPK